MPTRCSRCSKGPSAIAFIEADGDAVAVAKALADSARDTKVLAIRGGVMQGRTISAADVEELAKLPPFDVAARPGARRDHRAADPARRRSLNTPLQDLFGLIDARIEQLQGQRRHRAVLPRAAAAAAEPSRSPPQK